MLLQNLLVIDEKHLLPSSFHFTSYCADMTKVVTPSEYALGYRDCGDHLEGVTFGKFKAEVHGKHQTDARGVAAFLIRKYVRRFTFAPQEMGACTQTPSQWTDFLEHGFARSLRPMGKEGGTGSLSRHAQMGFHVHEAGEGQDAILWS